MNLTESSPSPAEIFLHLVERAGHQAVELRQGLEMESLPDPKSIRYASKIATGAERLLASARTLLQDQNFETASKVSQDSLREVRHELRNQLNHLTGPAQLLRRHLKTIRWQPALERLHAALDSSLEVIDSFGSRDQGYLHSLDTSPGSLFEAQVEPRLSRTTVEPASILVADDDPEISDFLSEVLAAQGHEVTLAPNGPEALRLALDGDFDLLLLDLGLPVLSGFEVLEKLESAGLLHHLPVIIVTGRRKVQDAVRCIEHGADDFLTKPLQLELLHARVTSCLERKRLREAEFKQFFPPQLARQFARHPDLRDMEGKFAEVTLLFCDIRGFSSITERLGPRETVRWLRAVMGELSASVIDNGGVLVDYAGDELLAMWGAPAEVADHAERACLTAVDMLRRLPRLNEAWAPVIGARTNFGIGINSGRALVGNIGTGLKFKYGPLGNSVNLASRVQGVTKMLQSNLLITGATREALPPGAFPGQIRRVCQVRVLHIDEPVHLYEIAVDPPPGWDALHLQYENALAAFEAGRLQEAIALLGQVLSRHPSDGPSFQLLNRIAAAKTSSGTSPNPVWTLQEK